MKLKALIVTLLLTACTFAQARVTVTYSGYIVSKVMLNTSALFETKGIIKTLREGATLHHLYKMTEDQEAQGMLPVLTFMDYEQYLIDRLLLSDLITVKQAEEAIKKSQEVGGLQANGYNLMYLHVFLLDALVNNHLITTDEAQRILDKSWTPNETLP